MINIRIGRRAQVRGIDFSMALIIFVLVMSQILIMTSTLIQSSYTVSFTNERESNVKTLANGIVNTEGTPTNWGHTLTAALPPNWVFGLASNERVGADPTKIGRLAQGTNSSFILDYNTIKRGLNGSIRDKSFKIEISYSVNVSISSVTPQGTNLVVKGEVKNENTGLNSSRVTVFGVNGAGVVTTSTTSLVNGTYSATLTYGALPSYSLVVAIVDYGSVNQAATTRTYVNGVTVSTGSLTLEERLSQTAPPSLDIHVAGTSANYDYYTLFAPVSSTSTVTSNSDTVTGGIKTSIEIPSNGLVVVVAVSRTINEVAFAAFPTSLDGTFSSAINPPVTPNATSTSFSVLMVSRGVLLEFKITVWEDAE